MAASARSPTDTWRSANGPKSDVRSDFLDACSPASSRRGPCRSRLFGVVTGCAPRNLRQKDKTGRGRKVRGSRSQTVRAGTAVAQMRPDAIPARHPAQGFTFRIALFRKMLAYCQCDAGKPCLSCRAGMLGHLCAGPPVPRVLEVSSNRRRKRTGKRARFANPPSRLLAKGTSPCAS